MKLNHISGFMIDIFDTVNSERDKIGGWMGGKRHHIFNLL